jgi:hypothetical protein
MLRRVNLVMTDVLVESIASIIRVTRIVDDVVFLLCLSRLLVTANAIHRSQILVTLLIEALRSTETSVLTRATRLTISEAGILQNHVVNLYFI